MKKSSKIITLVKASKYTALLFFFFFKFSSSIGQEAPEVIWDKTFGGSGLDTLPHIQQTSDGGYIVAGNSESNDGDISDGNNGNSDYWIVKLDGLGNKVWDKTYGGSGDDFARSIQQTSDGGYIVTGYMNSNDGDVTDGNNRDISDFYHDYWIIKLDGLGNKVWDKTYGGSDYEYAESIQQTSDGGYIVAGHTLSNDGDISDGNNGSADYWIIKLDGSGNKVWDKTYGGSDFDYVESIHQTSDGGYVVAGRTHSNDGDVSNNNISGWSNSWIMKLNDLGNKEWDKCYGSGNDQHAGAHSIQQTSDGGYIFSMSEPYVGFRIIKLKGENPESANQIEIQNIFSLYPNPAYSKVLIHTASNESLEKVTITDMTGKIVKQLETQNSTSEIDVNTLPKGVYFVKVGNTTQKLITK